MTWVLVLLSALCQDTAPRPSIRSERDGPSHRNVSIIYYDDAFLFLSRNYGSASDPGGNTEPGLFVHSKAADRWIRITAISAAGGRFGSSSTSDPAAAEKLRRAAIGWDFTMYAQRPYIEQPLRTGSAIVFPEVIEYDQERGRYELRYLTSWGVPSAETVLYIDRADLISAFAKR